MSATPDSTFTSPEPLIADLQRQLAEGKAERDEALEQRTVTTEVPGVINSSPGDLATVFHAMTGEGDPWLRGASRYARHL